jgi:sulfur-carrier protein
MPQVTIRYWAAAKDAAGVPEESVAAATLADALDAILAGHEAGKGFRDVLARSSFLIDGTRANKAIADAITLSDGAVVEVLPPFAGG